MSIRSWLALSLLAGSSLLHAQAGPTAKRAGDLQVGGGFGIADPDYGPNKLKGINAYSTFDFNNHLGVEVDFRFLRDSSPMHLYEKTYEVGARYHVTRGRFVPYAKAMFGRGVFNFQYDVANLAYNMYAVGGGTDYRVVPSINVRADFEYQRWLGFPSNGLTPLVGTIGVAYHFH